MSDAQERELERRARAGDAEAAAALLRMLERRGASFESFQERGLLDRLDALEDATVLEEGSTPVQRLAAARAVQQLVTIARSVPARARTPLAPRLARLDDDSAREVLASWYPALGVVIGAAEERRSSGLRVPPPSFRPVAALDAACEELVQADTHLRVAALHVALDRLVLMHPSAAPRAAGTQGRSRRRTCVVARPGGSRSSRSIARASKGWPAAWCAARCSTRSATWRTSRARSVSPAG